MGPIGGDNGMTLRYRSRKPLADLSNPLRWLARDRRRFCTAWVLGVPVFRLLVWEQQDAPVHEESDVPQDLDLFRHNGPNEPARPLGIYLLGFSFGGLVIWSFTGLILYIAGWWT